MSFDSKMERARFHSKAFNEAIRNTIGEHGLYSQVCEYHYINEGRQIEVRVRFTKARDLSPDLPGIIGDTIYNFRSGLEHLAFDLARAYTKTGFNPRTVSFPIHGREASWNSHGIGAVSQMHPEVRDIIKAMQPCHRGNPPDYPLALLNHLSNEDKHHETAFRGAVREIRSILLSPKARDVRKRETFASVAENVGVLDNVHLGLIEDHTDVANFLLDVTGPNPDVVVDTDVAMDVAFSDPGPTAGKVVARVFSDIAKHLIRDVYPALKGYL